MDSTRPRPRALALSITSTVPPSATADFVVCIILACLALFWVALRVMARMYTRTKLCFNDYAMFWAMFWGVFLAVNSIMTVQYGGVGHHMSTILDVAPQNLEPMLKTVFIGQFGWALSNIGVKLSIIDLYVKIFGRDKRFRVISYSLMGAVTVYFVLVVLLALLICRPVAFNWDVAIPGGHCDDQKAAFLSSAVLNCILDVAILALPLPMLWGLKMVTSKKIGVTIMLSVGISILGITIWRMVILSKFDTSDLFYQMGYLSIATNFEPLLGISVACLPVCRPLINIFGRKARSTSPAALSTFERASDSNGKRKSAGSALKYNIPADKGGRHSDTHSFQRLHDSYEVTDFIPHTTEVERGVSEESPYDDAGDCNGDRRIKITATWDVESQQRY